MTHGSTSARVFAGRKTPMPQAVLPQKQSGVTLIVMLVMLVVITLTSIGVMRSALSTDQVSNNARMQSVAMQAAQIGLRYCEREMVKSPAGVTVHGKVAAGSPQAWESFANWNGTGTVTVSQVPSSYFAANTVAVTPNKFPQCLVETIALSGGDALLVTSRGFSSDFVEDGTTGATMSGSVVWLQSTVQLAATP
jgi:type IV pilus assembly protein PilX